MCTRSPMVAFNEFFTASASCRMLPELFWVPVGWPKLAGLAVITYCPDKSSADVIQFAHYRPLNDYGAVGDAKLMFDTLLPNQQNHSWLTNDDTRTSWTMKSVHESNSTYS
jgi:hypothetical protein